MTRLFPPALDACCFSLIAVLASGAEPPRQPNVIFVLADDLGYAELGCYGNGFNETPHLDALANHGVRFTQAYASAPVCSPYRAALLTGQHPARIGITDYLRPNSANALSNDHRTLPEMFQQAGYRTGIIGKWHLTGYEHHGAAHEVRPAEHGFAWDFAGELKGVGNGANFWPYVFRKQTVRWVDITNPRLGKDEYLTDRLNLEAEDFIERNRDRPFFLFLSHYAPHTILNGKPELVAKYRRKHKPGPSSRTRCYLCQDHGQEGDALNHWAADHNPHLAAMLESIDEGIGRLRTKLAELALTENTIFVFSSDNGGETNVTSNTPLRGGKSQLYEGGIRVPLIVAWPGVAPQGQVCDHLTSNIDFYPTLLAAAKIEPDDRHTLDGESILTALQHPTRDSSKAERTLYWHYPLDKPHFLGGVSSGAIREGDWKLIESFDPQRTELYRLSEDPSEKRDLAKKHSKQARRLRGKLAMWQISVGATIPSAPLLTEPRGLYFADHFSTGQVSDRWFFNKDWSAEEGLLKRSDAGTDTTRIFLKETLFQNALIRFDFQMLESKDIRLVTGGGGNYNSIIHIRPDHFYIQTAQDKTGPYFSYRHGECAFNFKPKQWYTMTVEFFGDQVVAHLDHDHLAFAKHPIVDKQRSYFALQVDQSPANFDNIRIFDVKRHPQTDANLVHIAAASGKHPVSKSLVEQLEIQKRNAHEWFYQRREEYRVLVKRVDELDVERKAKFPEVFRSHKEFKKRVGEMRKKLHAEDPAYKKTLFATYAAERAITDWLLQKRSGSSELPLSRRKREIERLRKKHERDSEYQRLAADHALAQKKLETDYPQLFLTDEEINRYRKLQRAKVQETPEFKEMLNRRAAAYRTQQDYLFEHDAKLAELRKQMAERRN